MVDILSSAASALGFPGLLEDREQLFLKVGTALIQSFESMRISKNMNTLCSSFQVSFADKWRQSNEPWPLKPGAQVFVGIGSDAVFTGYIDRLDVAVTNDDRHIEIEGRDRTSDLIDCAATVTLKTELKNVDVVAICNNFTSQFGIVSKLATGVSAGATFTKFTAKQDETVFECIERAAKLRGLLLTSDYLGNIVITNRATSIVAKPSVKNLTASFNFVAALAPALASSVDLQQGSNVLQAEASYDETERFQQYIVKGQNRGTSQSRGLISSQVTGVAIDSGVSRFRPTIILAEGAIDIAAAKKRAEWELTTRAAKAVDVSCTVQGWRKPDGKLWAVNELVSVDMRFVGIEPSQMLVTEVEFSKDKGAGTLTKLKLTRGDAYKPQPVLAATTNQLGWGDFKVTSLLGK